MIRPIKAAARMVAPLGIPLAWRQLVDDKKRMVAAILGITFGIMRCSSNSASITALWRWWCSRITVFAANWS